MPELPEVETVRTGLSKLIVKKIFTKVTVFDSPKSFPNTDSEVDQFLIGSTVLAVARRAKLLMIHLSFDYSLVIHLKMTGQLVYRGEQNFGAGHPNDSLIGELPDRSTRVQFEFSDGSRLFFNDQRKFGWVKLMPTVEIANLKFMQTVGPEPLEPGLTKKVFIERIRKRNNSVVKSAILDQSTLAGVGNIYADESLWGAEIHPATRVRDVKDEELAELLKQIKFVLALSIEKGGSTDRNYVDAEGKRGSYIDFARVFRREGQPCQRCGYLIEKIRVAGRGTHFCPNCQIERVSP